MAEDRASAVPPFTVSEITVSCSSGAVGHSGEGNRSESPDTEHTGWSGLLSCDKRRPAIALQWGLHGGHIINVGIM